MELKKKIITRVFMVFFLTVIFWSIRGGVFSFADTIKEDGIEYSILNGEASITKYNGDKSELYIPSEIKGYAVTSIGEAAFCNCSDNLKSVIIPNSVTIIRTQAFESCSSLENIIIPNSVKIIEEYAFNSCSSLKNIRLSENLSLIDNGVFQSCSSLENITIPNNVTLINEFAFSSCNSLKSITIPDNVITIGRCAFDDCKNLKSIAISSSVTTIGESAFEQCSSLENITMPNSIIKIGKGAFSFCSSLENITIPSSVTTIEEDLFKACSKLENITISNSITTIGKYAFSFCSSLENITIPNSVTTIGESAFWECSSLKNITISNSVTEIGKYAFMDCSSLESILIPSSVTSIGQNIFARHNTNLVVTVERGSHAQIYAKKNRIAFHITNPMDIKQLTIENLSNREYTDKEIKPKLIIKEGNKLIKEGYDYTLSYKNNKNIGLATILIQGKDNYYGQRTITFKIVPKTITKISQTYSSANRIELSWNKISGVSGYRIYRSTSKNGAYTNVGAVKGSGTTSYINSGLSSGKIYYYKVRAYKTVGKTNYYSNYSSSLIASTKCSTPSITVKSPKTKVAKVSWKKVSGASGYRIYRATSKKGTYEYVKNIASGSTSSYTNIGLKKGKTYYYKIQAYKTVNGSKVYSYYSSLKYIKVK
ncbi:leucine-rich repeat protein [Terrisporobacter hibernicus]|uniref:Leucine-rich repeat protein n=1 Tax=Terrisporobacter hibernicus TaxID=2813371 RepID=A0AAX2ZK05_9FIRM|nr:leucine-rich repeat protein [Terrisporobacter hibernicus]UEL49181.1 leucine-rich repeat protein [Terrisporobacter hibernicus]